MPGTNTTAPDSDRSSSPTDTSPGNPAMHRRRLGTDLRRLRQDSGLRLEDAAAHIGVRPSTLSRIETGLAPTRISYLTMLLDLYRIDDPGQRGDLADSALLGQRKDLLAYFADLLSPGTCRYLRLEAIASRVRAYSALAVPGLIQTAGYATAACRASRPDLSSAQIARLAELFARRQETLWDDGPQVHLIIDQAALVRPIAPVQVINEQLRHLIAVASTNAVSVQVAEPIAARAVLSPAFTILTFGSPDAEVACCDRPGGQVVTTTCAGQVQAAHATFTALVRTALPPARSIELIENLMRG